MRPEQLTEAQREARIRQSGLTQWGSSPSNQSAPRYSTRSLSDDDIRVEIARGAEEGFLDALMTEAAKRGMEV